jgi:hypothetical protein
MGIFSKGRNKMAFSGTLICPHPHPKNYSERCGSTKFRKDEAGSTPLMIRYVCRQCGKGVRYDISNNNNLTSQELAAISRR